jgi:hypothetical protein
MGMWAFAGKYTVCVSGKSKSFGKVTGRKPDGIIVHADGRCQLMEYAGGFDGYFSADAGDGHEDGLAQAVKEMLRDGGAKIGKKAGRNNKANAHINGFMQKMFSMSKPNDLDYPRVCQPSHGLPSVRGHNELFLPLPAVLTTVLIRGAQLANGADANLLPAGHQEG